ncbi:MAG: helix-turn-helix domain-containing protein [Candidatus Bathyarchaeota archaeon]|nr:helix-turn-helix domain-containing protein [Candidatus Bathyarchaeota archaeon]
MSENNEEKMRKLREEVNLLRDQLIRISEQLDETSEEVTPPLGETPAPEPKPEPAPKPEPTPRPQELDEETVDEPESWDEGSDELWSEPDTEYDDPSEYRRRPRRKFKVKFPDEEFGDRLGDYIGGFVEEVMEGVASEIEQSLFRDRRPTRVRPAILSDDDVKKTASVMSALGNEHRIKILKELSWGGLYSSDLQETLKEISPSTLSKHLEVLQDVGLIIQERRRGRYLISMNGRLAIKMASSIAKRAKVPVDIEDMD